MQPYIKYVRTALLLIIALGGISILSVVGDTLTTSSRLSIMTTPIEELHTHNHNVGHGDTLASHGHTVDVVSEVFTVPDDMWVTGADLITKNAPQFVIHHIHLVNMSEKDEFCPQLPQLLFDLGQDSLPSGEFPEPYGLFLPKGSQLIVTAMLHNPEPPLGLGEEYRNVSVGFKLHVDRFARFHHLKPLSFHVVALSDQNICNATTFEVPPHSKNFVKASSGDASTMTLTRGGTIVALGAHIHAWEGGKKLDVFVNDKLVTSFIPKRISETPEVWRTDPYPTSIRVNPGDRITTAATYDNPFDISEDGPMAMLGVYVSYDQ